MTNSASRLPNGELQSGSTFESVQVAGVSFTIRRMTLRQRISLLQELHTLYLEREFSGAGSSQADRLHSQLTSLRIDDVFLRWAVTNVTGLQIDGRAVSAGELAEFAPESLVCEILERIREAVSLSQDEEKN
ncbi:MAG: hypothetical protein ABI972_00970 [Acidobacteriota bacterium]